MSLAWLEKGKNARKYAPIVGHISQILTHSGVSYVGHNYIVKRSVDLFTIQNDIQNDPIVGHFGAKIVLAGVKMPRSRARAI